MPRRRCHKSDMPLRSLSSNFAGILYETSTTAGLPPAGGGGGGIGYARCAAAVVHHGIEAIALFLEIRHQRSLERAAAWQLDAHRIDETSVDEYFIMEVGPGCHAGLYA